MLNFTKTKNYNYNSGFVPDYNELICFNFNDKSQLYNTEKCMKSWLNTIKYTGFVFSVYAAQVALFYSFYEKFSGSPEWINELLANSPLGALTPLGWIFIGVLEFLAILFVVISVVRREFLNGHDLCAIKASLVFGMLTLAIMAFGTSLAGKYDLKAGFIYYLGASAVLLVLAELYTLKEEKSLKELE